MLTLRYAPREKRRRRAVLKWLLMDSLLLLWAFCLTQSIQTVSSMKMKDENMDSNDDGVASTLPPKRTLLDSIWKTFKQIADKNSANTDTSRRSSSSSASKLSSPQESQKASFQEQREAMANRRSLLFENTLSEHYQQQLLQSTSSSPSSWNLQDNQQDDLPNLSQTQTKIHWKQNHPVVDNVQCSCFSESSDSYWSFQWCPKEEVFQGRRDSSTGKMQQGHSLGRYVSHSDIIRNDDEAHHAAKALLHLATAKHPKALSIEMYQDGDRCDSQSTFRRVSAVVVHDRNRSDLCSTPRSDSSLKDLTIIEGVEEIRTCQYVVHVCKSSNDRPTSIQAETFVSIDSTLWKSLASSASKTNAFNETLSATLELIDLYRRRTVADTNAKLSLNPLTSFHRGLPPMPQSRVRTNLELIKEMFIHAYDGYMYNGYPAEEVKPITCQPATFGLVKIPGVTLIDSLDTLVVLGNYTEFARAVERLRELNENVARDAGLFNAGGLFAINQNVSVFETNIRVLGGLLSAHQLAVAFLKGRVFEHNVRREDGTVLIGENRRRNPCSVGGEADHCTNATSMYWEYDGFLLDMAYDIGSRLLPAFQTETGIPYGTVNLISGVPMGETTIASLAGGGTLSLEMELLGRLTGEERFGLAAKLAARALWMRRAPNDLLGKHICTRRGEWTESLSGIGSNSDSFYEYLIKHHTLFPEDSDFWPQAVSAYAGVYRESRLGEWYADVDMSKGMTFGGGSQRRVFEALMAFYPGLQVLLGEIVPAARTLNSFFLVREHLGFLPERFNYGTWTVDTRGGAHLLRPELLESAYFLHRASKGIQQKVRSDKSGFSERISESSSWQWAGDFALHAIEKLTRSECGYASPREVSMSTTGSLAARKGHVRLLNEMPSYFLSETLKYLFLLFDDQNPLHLDEDRDWVFTTEAHPIHYEKKQSNSRDSQRLKTTKHMLKQRLQKRLGGTRGEVSTSFHGLRDEKWTSRTEHKEFLRQLKSSNVHSRGTYSGASDQGNANRSMGSFLPDISLSMELDRFNERWDGNNLAIQSFHSLGRGKEVTMSCSNLHNGQFLWMRALNGGIFDYSDSYVSRVQDELSIPQNKAAFVGWADGVALHGAGFHIDSMYNSFSRCAVQIPGIAKEMQSSKLNENPLKHRNDGSDSSALIEMGDFGNFEVSAFPEGSGFFIQHVESGETITTTIIDSENESQTLEPFFLVYSSADATASSHKSAVMVDTRGNSFTCMVEIIDANSKASGEEPVCEIESQETETTAYGPDGTVVAQFPCVPGLFGPAHLHNLQQEEEIEVEGTLHSSLPGEEFGCMNDSDERTIQSSSENTVLAIVQRGRCSFQEKAMNQKSLFNAEGVIVVNSENELFVMSGNENITSDLVPLTVLVSRSDGEDILEILNSSEDQKAPQVQARIALFQQEIGIEQSESGILISEAKFWPAAKANSEALQIFSPSGWGVQATQRLNTNGQAEWQLLLLAHGT